MHFIAFFVSFTVLYTLGKLFLFDCLFEPISRRNTPIFAEISKKQKTKVNLPNLCFARVPIKYAQNSHGKRQSEGGGGDETEKKGEYCAQAHLNRQQQKLCLESIKCLSIICIQC